MKSKNALDLGFRVDTPALLKEIADCGLPQRIGVMKVPLNVFQGLLAKVAGRAIELNDPELNVLMLSLNLYEVPPNEIVNEIEKQLYKINK